MELLARVNTPMSSPSACDQQQDEGSWGSWNGDSKGSGDTFGDCIPKKEKNVLRIGFQNIGGFSINKEKYKERIIRKGIDIKNENFKIKMSEIISTKHSCG